MSEIRTKLIEPLKFLPSMLVSTTATNPDPTWSAGTYGLGDVVLREVVWDGKDHMRGLPMLRRFESLVAANTSTPGEAPDKWIDAGPANTVAMFDGKISTETVLSSGDLVVRLAPGSAVQGMSLIGVRGNSVRVRVLDDDAVSYDESQSLLPDNVTNWFEYFTAPVDQVVSRVLFMNLPAYFYNEIEITIAGTGVGVGNVSFGPVHDIGSSPALGAEIGEDDYSIKTADEYGDAEFQPRPSADYQNIVVEVQKSHLNGVRRLLRRLRATPCVLIGSEDPDYAESLINFGWVGAHRTVIDRQTKSLLDIEFKGLT